MQKYFNESENLMKSKMHKIKQNIKISQNGRHVSPVSCKIAKNKAGKAKSCGQNQQKDNQICKARISKTVNFFFIKVNFSMKLGKKRGVWRILKARST